MEDFRKNPIWIAPTEDLTVEIEVPVVAPVKPAAPRASDEPTPAAPPPSDPQD